MTDEGRKEKLNFTVNLRIGKEKVFFNFICYSKVQQLQLLSQSIHAQTEYNPIKYTCNSTITTQGMPTAMLQVLFKKEETNHFTKRRKLTSLQSPFVH